jgi:hypothetical protein
MLLINGRGCHRISRERASVRLIATITGGGAAGSLRLSQDEEYTWWLYSEPTEAHIPLEPTELLDELLAAECEFRANELIGWEHRPRAHPALAHDLVRRASQARVAALEREQRRRRARHNPRRLAGGQR